MCIAIFWFELGQRSSPHFPLLQIPPKSRPLVPFRAPFPNYYPRNVLSNYTAFFPKRYSFFCVVFVHLPYGKKADAKVPLMAIPLGLLFPGYPNGCYLVIFRLKEELVLTKFRQIFVVIFSSNYLSFKDFCIFHIHLQYFSSRLSNRVFWALDHRLGFILLGLMSWVLLIILIQLTLPNSGSIFLCLFRLLLPEQQNIII